MPCGRHIFLKSGNAAVGSAIYKNNWQTFPSDMSLGKIPLKDKTLEMLNGLEIQMIDEAEYKALVDVVAELTWLQALLNELGIRSSSTPILWCDNLGATYLSANLIFYARTKHVEIDYHVVREKVAQGDLRVQQISTHDQIADIFTKPLETPQFLFLRFKLQVVARPYLAGHVRPN
ncbi:gag/pol polyprotein [Tanacetum coccineum]